MARFGTSVLPAAGLLTLAAGLALAGPFDPPAGYYSNATGTGATLKSQLTAAMSAGHIQRNYGDYRFSAAIHDADPNNPGRIFLVYNGASVPATWDSGVTWNREHVWPESRQPGSVSNSTTGNLGDPHALKPCNPSINSSRGNKPFGDASTTGNHGSIGSYYFPGDTDKGDIARVLFYSDTRWGPSLGLSLVNSFPAGNQMGGLDACIAWHYLDEPDTFELRRNHAIFSQSMNPSYYTNNRNAFIDMPEAVWSIYVDQANDTTLFIGSADADGASAESITFNTLVGDESPTATFTLTKDGVDGTYYSVTSSAFLTTSIAGRHNAFPIGSTDTSRSIEIALSTGAADTPGFSAETVTVNNLDLTLLGGQGNGANDADDIVTVLVNVYAPAIASFSEFAPVTEITLDLGVIDPGTGDAAVALDLFNIAGPFGAPMDIELISSVGDTASLSTTFAPVISLPAGQAETILAVLDDAASGDFEAVYTFRAYNDRGLFANPGSAQDLVLTLSGQVGDTGCPADLSEPFGELNFFDVSAFLALYAAEDPQADFLPDGVFNFFDVSGFLSAYGAGCP